MDPETGSRRVDAWKLVNLPLMQSPYIEVMRMLVSYSVTRQVTQPLVQVCSHIEHYDEGVWGVEGHPASEFWAYRYVKHVEDHQPEDKVSAGQLEGKKCTKAAVRYRGPTKLVYPFR